MIVHKLTFTTNKMNKLTAYLNCELYSLLFALILRSCTETRKKCLF